MELDTTANTSEQANQPRQVTMNAIQMINRLNRELEVSVIREESNETPVTSKITTSVEATITGVGVADKNVFDR